MTAPVDKNGGKPTRLLKSIQLRNFLSFGPKNEPLELQNLNVLIGPNGSGKSNLIEAISFLRAAPGDLRDGIRRGGGALEWIWKGAEDAKAEVRAIVEGAVGERSLRHSIQFRAVNQVFDLCSEWIEGEPFDVDNYMPYFLYEYDQDVKSVGIKTADGPPNELDFVELEPNKSILAQRRDPVRFPEITYLSNVYTKIAIFREWVFGRGAPCREPQQADMRADRLDEDFSNLGLFLNRIRRNPKSKRAVLDALHELYVEFDDYDVSIDGGSVQVFFTEGEYTIPARRLSDGTLRYLCLLAILFDPQPPPLICIEEPELGLHPDILPSLAKHLIDASTRTQLIVTTHSDILVDAMSDRPEAVVVCEKHDGATTCRRLKADELSEWLDKYRLGELWTKGGLGGTRW